MKKRIALVLICFCGLASAQVVDYNPNKDPIKIENVPQNLTPTIFNTGKKQSKLIVRDGKSFGKKPLYVVEGRIIDEKEFHAINPNKIESMHVLKGENATRIYGEKGTNGVIDIRLKKELKIIQ